MKIGHRPGGIFLGFALVTLSGLLAAHAHAAAAASKETAPPPIHVTSNRMEAESKKDIIIFIGNVVANRGKMQIKADRLEVFIKKKKEPDKGSEKGAEAATKKGSGMASQGDIERIVAIGNVLLRQDEDKFASGARMDYHEERGVAVLSGNPRAWEGKNQIVGDRIELYLREERTVVLGSPSRRVGVTLYPANENASAPQQ